VLYCTQLMPGIFFYDISFLVITCNMHGLKMLGGFHYVFSSEARCQTFMDVEQAECAGVQQQQKLPVKHIKIRFPLSFFSFAFWLLQSMLYRSLLFSWCSVLSCISFFCFTVVFLTVLFDVHHSHSLTESGSLVQGQSDRQLFLLKSTEAEILDEIQTKVLRAFLLATHSHLYTAFPWDFYFFKLTQPLTVFIVLLQYTVKEKGEKPDRKPYPLPYGLRNPYRNLKSENFDYAKKPQRNFTFMNSASVLDLL